MRSVGVGVDSMLRAAQRAALLINVVRCRRYVRSHQDHRQ